MGLKRGRHTAIYALSCLLLAGAAVASSLGPQRLAVVVPAHAGDLTRAVSALDRWPTTCSPVTEVNVDLVLYYAEGEDDTEPLAALDAIASTAGKCFGDTKLVYANLTPEEDVYPKGPSVQFYKMFTDEDVKTSLQEYDALAIIEWDVLVASDRSFAELYRAAFSNAEDFWVKGSNIEGTNFHNTMAESSEMWHVMGHINGNAIYNNNDPMFGEFVEYTLARWEYRYPYDVALWATISDFPYSWPLWQRFSSKFVTTNLISNVGYEHIDSKTVSDAVAGETLFIHGSSVDNGNLAVLKATSASATEGSGVPRNQADDDLYCNEACGSDSAADSLAYGMSTVCDPTCTASGSRFGGYLCGAGDSAKFGAMCRMCYTAVDKAREAESSLDAGLHVIMCDTNRPPAAAACGDECSLKKDTVCDEACGTGVHGDYNCGWRGLGSKCRFCFNDIETALTADEVAKRHGGRVVMCDTYEPPIAAVTVTEMVASAATMSRRLIPEEEAAATRELTQDEPKWKTNQKWKDTKKWQGDEENGILPKWKTNQKWKKNRCDDGCTRTSNDGTKGRVCDKSCDGGHPYGRLGCGAKNNMYGRYCRTCFNDVDLAKAADTPYDRAIMCDTVLPVTAYDHRRLTDANRELTEDEPKWKTNQKWKDTKKWQGDEENGVLPKWKTNQKWKKNRCDEGCARTSNDGTKGRVCDESCDGGHPYGRLGCGAKNNMYGRYCRTCFNDVDLAKAADTPYDRAIMCDTVLPVTAYDHRQLSEANRELTEAEPKWKTNQKWKDTKKWQGDEENGILPKWKTNQKWKKNRCDEGCARTSNDGTKGRVCDESCDGGHPYGRLGCGAKNNMYGRYCRTCFNDVDLAKAADTPYDRAIMCDTVEPVSAYQRHRQLVDVDEASEEPTAAVAVADEGETGSASAMRRSADRAFTGDVKRGEICAFVEGHADRVLQTDVTVQSILEFVPGVRVAVAAEPDSLAAYERTIGVYAELHTGVRISSTPNAHLSSLFADQHCGKGTKLILYVQPGSVLSRSFTSKDTHTPRGELLVVYGDARKSFLDAEIARETAAVLGFDAPSFTYGTDLMLPVGANAELRAELEASPLSEEELYDISSVPQLLAAHSYAQDTEGVHFVDPQAWVTQNLFKATSVWDIPLMKPRFACAIPNPTALPREDAMRADALERSLRFFRMGGSCENGLIAADSLQH